MVTLESYAHAIIQLSTDGVVSKDTIGLMKSVGVPVMAKRTGFLWDEKAYKSFESTMKVFGKAEEVDGSDYSFTETMIWGDNAVKISTKELYEGKEYNDNYTLPIVNGLVQSYNFNSSQYTAVYNQSKRLIEWGKERDQTIIIWDGDKLVSATNNAYGYVYDYTLTYEKSCKKKTYTVCTV